MLAASASALSLGSSRGQVTIGAPLDLAFEIQPDAGTDVAGSCVTAQVIAGEIALSNARVRVTPLAETRGGAPEVRVQTTVAVDEPVVRVTLGGGCSSRVTRTYTFLAELPSTVVRSGAPVDVARLAQAVVPETVPFAEPGMVRMPVARGQAQAVASGSQLASSRPISRPQREANAAPPSVVASPPARSIKPKAVAETSTAKAPASRLVVEPLDTWLDRPVMLRSAPLLSMTPDEQPSAQRAQAAALWKALNAQPGDVDADAERAKAREGDLTAVKEQAERDRALAVQLQEQVATLESERFSPTLVYGLAGLLALALAAVGWALLRMRDASDRAVKSWLESVERGSREAVHGREPALSPISRRDDLWPVSQTLPSPDLLSGPDDLGLASAPAPLQPSPEAPAPAPAATKLIVNPGELFDIQQQAEFFVSVGEHQQAIDVLKNHIADHRKTSPLAYLDLLRLYHTLSRVDEYSQLRAQFMQFFNARVPEFAAFNLPSRSLERYLDALAEIEAQWTSAAVLDLLRSHLFVDQGRAAVEPFDLSAFDDLLLLLAIAQTTPPSARGAPGPRERTTPLPPPRGGAAVFDGVGPSSAAVKAFAAATGATQDPGNDIIDFEFESLPGGLGLDSPVSKPATLDSLPMNLELPDASLISPGDPLATPETDPGSVQALEFAIDSDLALLRLELEKGAGKTTAGSLR
jgi:pilus assembly protein FimV